jgi:hypothetical protein
MPTTRPPGRSMNVGTQGACLLDGFRSARVLPVLVQKVNQRLRADTLTIELDALKAAEHTPPLLGGVVVVVLSGLRDIVYSVVMDERPLAEDLRPICIPGSRLFLYVMTIQQIACRLRIWDKMDHHAQLSQYPYHPERSKRPSSMVQHC